MDQFMNDSTDQLNHDAAEEIYRDSIFMSSDYLRRCAGRVFWYTIAITCLNMLISALVQSYGHQGDKNQNKDQKNSSATEDVTLKNSFQLTNMIVNLFLGCVGIYYWFMILPGDCSEDEKMMGGEMDMKRTDCLTPSFFAEFQLGYQVWSFPMCLLINESVAMMIHHFFVAMQAGLSCILVLGARYFCVFFFGVIEISSVFLSIMNAFKSRPDWVKKMPEVFACVKLLFSASFFCTRVILWIPYLYEFFKISWGIGISRGEDNKIYHVLMVAAFTPALFLTFLQLMWATKIVKGLMHMFGIGSH